MKGTYMNNDKSSELFKLWVEFQENALWLWKEALIVSLKMLLNIFIIIHHHFGEWTMSNANEYANLIVYLYKTSAWNIPHLA